DRQYGVRKYAVIEFNCRSTLKASEGLRWKHLSMRINRFPPPYNLAFPIRGGAFVAIQRV
ncbi:hypothetical protein Egran_00066, partial [Elaphomyces granulatus]